MIFSYFLIGINASYTPKGHLYIVSLQLSLAQDRWFASESRQTCRHLSDFCMQAQKRVSEYLRANILFSGLMIAISMPDIS
jgi:peroxiredoxin